MPRSIAIRPSTTPPPSFAPGRGHFPNDQAALKILYLTIREHDPGRTNPTGKINGWKSILNALTMFYGDRLAVH